MSEDSSGAGKPPSQLLSDEELMELYRKNGDESAFATLYERHAGRVYGYLSHRVPVRHERDEVHQAVFLKFHQARHLYEPEYDVLQWLFVIARTTVTDHLRKGQRAVLTVEDREDGVSRIEGIAAVLPAESDFDLETLCDLSERERSVVQMRVLDELSYQQIAEKLGQSQSNVRQLLSRALKKLRLSLEAKGTAR